MNMNGGLPPQTIPDKQTEKDKVVVPPERLVELRENRDHANTNAAAFSALQIFEEQNPELKALTEEIRLKERALNEMENEYVYYRDEHENGISVEDAKRHENIIAHAKKELERIKTDKYELLKRLRGNKEGV